MMAPQARLVTVLLTAALAGLLSLGPMPQSSAAATRVAQTASQPALQTPAVAALAPRKAAVSAALKTTTGKRAVALTFDDGPDPRWTPRVLALLKKYKVKATFCLVGSRVRAYPQLVKQIVRDGHTLCNHTMNHDQRLRYKSGQRIASDLAQTNA